MNLQFPPGQPSSDEQIRKLEKINRALMARVEKSLEFSSGAFSLFQTAILLENKVKVRTADLEETLENLSEAYSSLKDARDEAEIAKQNLTAAIEAVSEGFALFDSDDRLVMCNAPFREILPDVNDCLAPETPFETIAARFASSRHLQLAKDESEDDWLKRRLAAFRQSYATFTQAFAGDRWVQVSNKKMATGATVIFQTDITDTVRSERVRHERELDEQSRLLQATIDHMPQGISMFSVARGLRTWNRRFVELLGLPPHLVTSRLTLSRLFNVLNAQNFIQEPEDALRLKQWLQSGDSTSVQGFEITRHDGMILSVDAKAMPGGGTVLTFTDITAARQATLALREANETLEQRVDERMTDLTREINERRAIERELLAAKEQAEEANKGKTRYLAAASHDLLQPLNASRIFLSLLLDSGLPARQARLAESADKAFGSVEQLLEALLDISRFETRSVETNITSVNLSTLFEVLQAEFRPISDRKNLTFRMRSRGIFVRSDQALLRRIIQNLLSNALRYTVEGGVLVAARRKCGRVSIEVYDTGPGIDADKQRLVFQEFKRLRQGHDGDTKGMGLGLAIVDRIAKLLNHGVELNSSPGRGSRFSVSLDEVEEETCVAPAEPGVFESRSPAHARCALIVENDLQILAGMLELLESRNFKAIPAVSAEEALDALDTMESLPDIIIADYHLDDGTGLEAINALRQKCGSNLPAIIITADQTANLKSDLLAQGVSLLRKPIRPQLLFQTIDLIA